MMTIEEARDYIIKRAPLKISPPWYFSFDDAVQCGDLSRELADEMIKFVHEHKAFNKSPTQTICIDDQDGNSFSETSIDLITDVIFANFYEKIQESFEAEGSYYKGQYLLGWFRGAIQVTYGDTETSCREYCELSGETLCAFPINEDDILEELEILLKDKYLSQNEWNWLDLVATNAPYESKKINNRLIKIATKHQTKEHI